MYTHTNLTQDLRHEAHSASVLPAANGSDLQAFRGSVLRMSRNGPALYERPADNSNSTGVGEIHQIFTFSRPANNINGRYTVHTEWMDMDERDP
ncbi:hypothetical protein GGR54DRAFT_639306 [Hypoxylon sp. NC1633]|nr:hypothetical protein GGR54DRAFT_639306 [Hypoxylon sp. NC1633]